jgi:hypothetical protein
MGDRSAHKRLIYGDCPSQAISKSMTAVEARNGGEWNRLETNPIPVRPESQPVDRSAH